MINILIAKKCILTHCLVKNSPKGSLLERLDYTIKETSQEISCATVSTNDTYLSSTYSDIGVLIKPGKVNYACFRDGGTLRLTNEPLICDEDGKENPTNTDIESAIDNKGQSLNEFLITDYSVIGIFVREDTMSSQFSLEEFESVANFYDQVIDYNIPFYILETGILVRCEKLDGILSKTNVEFDSIYK